MGRAECLCVLTVNGVVLQGTLGGLAGDVHDGAAAAPRLHATSHYLQEHGEQVIVLALSLMISLSLSLCFPYSLILSLSLSLSHTHTHKLPDKCKQYINLHSHTTLYLYHTHTRIQLLLIVKSPQTLDRISNLEHIYILFNYTNGNIF